MGSSFIGTWRCMVADPPKKTGRYCVAHRGLSFGSAYYTANKGDTHYPVGWAQLPDFRPNAWLDGYFDIPDRDNSSYFYGVDYKPKQKQQQQPETVPRKCWLKKVVVS